MLITFKEFLAKATAEEVKNLKKWSKIIEKAGFIVEDHTDDDDPYLWAGVEGMEGGIRIYYIAGVLTYRQQDTAESKPYGPARAVGVEEEQARLEDTGENSTDNKHNTKIQKELDEFVYSVFSGLAEKFAKNNNKDDDLNGDIDGEQ